MKVLVLHSLPPEEAGEGRTSDEFDLHTAAENIASVLPGAAVAGVRGEAPEIWAILAHVAPDVVFNLCEAPLGRPDFEAHVAALLEWIGVPFTGSGSETLALCRRKDRTNAVLQAAGLPVPRADRFPAFVKPADEDGSAGIHPGCLVRDAAERERERARYNGRPVMIEEFLPGREFVVSLWGGDGPDHAAIGETIFLNGLEMITYSAKWHPETADYANSPLSYTTEVTEELRENILAAARGAWRAVGVRGYVRCDIRLDAESEPRLIDINPNPELGPGVGICRAAIEAGWTWERFVTQQVEWALR
jgi:D-alanine-D-alanine ligase